MMMNLGTNRYRVVIVSPTPFYYHAKLYQHLASNPRIDLLVYFCSREALSGADARKSFRTNEDWGTEGLLEGYHFKFLRNYALRPTYFDWPFGLVNLDVWTEIREQKPDVVILQAWTNLTWWLTALAAFSSKIPFLFMTDANHINEIQKSAKKRALRWISLRKTLFPRCSGFLCSGEANRHLYLQFGVPESKLFPFRYSWGYAELLCKMKKLKPQRKQIRAQLGIPQDAFVILYSGRLSQEKRPLDLLRAFSLLGSSNAALVFAGDGVLRESLQDFIAAHSLKQVFLLGFQRRDEISKIYAMADLVVLPSAAETWGMVINEAMCCGLPVIVSDRVGAGADLVQHGQNGFVFSVGDIETLTRHIRYVQELAENQRLDMGAKSLALIQEWCSFKPDEALLAALDGITWNNSR